MTRRERLENKLAKREEWATKAKARSSAAFDKAYQISSMIPMGQPILVGHHSEAHARRDADRIWNGIGKGVEEQKLAEHHASRAAGLEAQLERSIFSDDRDAIEALEARIAEREAEAERKVALNKAWRKSKGDPAVFSELSGMTLAAAQRTAEILAQANSWDKQPVAGYELTSLRAAIRRDKERIAEIRTRQERTEKADAAGGVLVEKGRTTCRVTFPERPARAVIDALKAAGYFYQAGSWYGPTDHLPEGIE